METTQKTWFSSVDSRKVRRSVFIYYIYLMVPRKDNLKSYDTRLFYTLYLNYI